MKQRPAIRLENIVRQPVSDVHQAGSAISLIPQIRHRQPVVANVRQHALPPVGIDDGAQHVVARDKCVYGVFQRMGIEIVDIEFPIAMGADAAEFEALVATNPVGMLDIRQRKRLMAVFRIMDNRVTVGVEDFLRLVLKSVCQPSDCRCLENCLQRQ